MYSDPKVEWRRLHGLDTKAGWWDLRHRLDACLSESLLVQSLILLVCFALPWTCTAWNGELGERAIG
jgi:hypothetical protein